MKFFFLGLFTLSISFLSPKLHAEICDSGYTNHCNANNLFYCSENNEITNLDCGLGTCTEEGDNAKCIHPRNGDCTIESSFEECIIPLHCSLDFVGDHRICREPCAFTEEDDKICVDNNTAAECLADGEGLTMWHDLECAEVCDQGDCIAAGLESDAGSITNPDTTTDSGTTSDPLPEPDAGVMKNELDAGSHSPQDKDTSDAGKTDSNTEDNNCQSTNRTSLSIFGIFLFLTLNGRKKKQS